MKLGLRWIVAVLLLTLVVLLLTFGWLVTSQAGFRWVIDRILLPIVPQLTIESYEGRLAGTIKLQNIHYKNAKINVAVRDLHFDWSPEQLLSRTVGIDTLRLSHLDIVQIATTTPSTPLKTPALSIDGVLEQLKLPVDVSIGIMELSDVTFTAYQSDKALKVNRLALSAKIRKSLIAIEKIELKSHLLDLQGGINLHLNTSDNSSNNVDGVLSWEVKAVNVKSVSGETTVNGDINKLQINSRLAPPYGAAIEVVVEDILQDAKVSSVIVVNDIQLASIGSGWPNYQIQGTTTINATPRAARGVGQLTAAAINKNIVIDAQIKSDWQDNQLIIDVSANVPGIVEQLVIKAYIQPQLLATSNTEAYTVLLKWEDLNLTDVANKVSAKKNLINADTMYLETPSQLTPTNFSSETGMVLISGNLEEYKFTLESSIGASSQNQSEKFVKSVKGGLNLKGLGNFKQLIFEKIALSGAAGTLNGRGSLGLQPNLNIALNLSAKNLNPAVISPSWPGDLALELAINTTTTGSGSPLVQASLNTTGQLRYHPFTLEVAAELVIDANKGHRLTIDKLRLNSGDSKIFVDTIFATKKTLSANWLISSDDLEELVPNSSGKLMTKGMINIDIPLSKTPTINDLLHAIKAELSVSASNIDIFNTQIETLTARADINWQHYKNNDENKFAFHSKNFAFNSFHIASLSAQLSGEPESHQLKINVENTKSSMDLQLSGELLDSANTPQWQFVAESAQIDLFGLAPWHLQNSVNGMLSKSSQLINHHCWSNEDNGGGKGSVKGSGDSKKATLCFDAGNKHNVSQARFTLTELPVDYFSRYFPEAISWTDSFINGRGTVDIVNDQLSTPPKIDADIQLQTTAGKLNWQTLSRRDGADNSTISEPQQTVALGAGSFKVTAHRQAIKALLKLPIEAQAGFDSEIIIRLNNNTFTAADIEGRLSLVLDSIEPFNSFIPDTTGLKGKLNTQLRVGGSLAKPWFEGKLALSEGQLLLLNPGILLEDIALDVESERQVGISYQASVNSGGGALRAGGTLKIADDMQLSELQLSLEGESVKVLDTSEAVIFASPNITVATVGDLISVNGSITIPKARITPQKVPQSVITSSADEIVINNDDENEKNRSAAPSLLNITTNLNVILGDSVQIDGFGFKGTAEGSLNLIKQQGPLLANGTVNIVDGEYRAFGQGLIIDEGALLFTGGPATNPGINIKASRQPASGITVGVVARGSLSKPELTIFSEPSMVQSEQLSWLLLGQPLEQSSDDESSAINQLLLSLSLDKGDSLIRNLGATFNLDTLRLKPGSSEAGPANDSSLAELVLGKYLSPKLYVSYGIGLFNPVNVLSLEYSLSRYWKLISETSSTTSGGDIVYTIEK